MPTNVLSCRVPAWLKQFRPAFFHTYITLVYQSTIELSYSLAFSLNPTCALLLTTNTNIAVEAWEDVPPTVARANFYLEEATLKFRTNFHIPKTKKKNSNTYAVDEKTIFHILAGGLRSGR